MRKILSALVGTTLWMGALAVPSHGQTLICFKSSGGTGCTPVSAAAPLPVTGAVTATSTLKSTAAAPTYSEGTNNPFSSDLSGNLRVTLASGSVAITMASGAVSSGAYAAGALAAGTFAAGAGVDGWDLTQGATTDAAATAGSTGTLSAKMRLMTTQLATINTTLGSPFQAGGSIGNTTFAATQSGAWNITNISGTISLPTGAATSANQTNASQKTQIVDGSGNVVASTSNNLNVQCANCSGAGASAVDEASFTAGTSVLAPGGGFFQTTATSNPLTTGQQGMVQMTAQRAFFSNLRNASGTEVGTASTPLQVSLANTAANATAVKVDGSAVTQPVSAASLPLPSGAATAAKQPALGTAGSASTDVLSVQGIASMTALKVDGSGVTQPVSGTVTAAQATAANLNATVVGTGTFAVQATLANPSHASTTALGTSLSAKGTSGSLLGFNCTGIAGGSAGYCIAYNGSSVPGTGALTGANVLDFCYYDTTPRGCSLSRIPMAVTYGTGIQILISSATSPYTYTTGTNTGAITADYQ